LEENKLSEEKKPAEEVSTTNELKEEVKDD
jgi:hypothetical protein